jgi:hypothetical protein
MDEKTDVKNQREIALTKNRKTNEQQSKPDLCRQNHHRLCPKVRCTLRPLRLQPLRGCTLLLEEVFQRAFQQSRKLQARPQRDVLMLTFTQWTKTRKHKEKNNERPISQTSPIIRHQDQQRQADRDDPQVPAEGLPVFPIVR